MQCVSFWVLGLHAGSQACLIDAPKWKGAIIDFISYTCRFPTITIKNVLREKGLFHSIFTTFSRILPHETWSDYRWEEVGLKGRSKRFVICSDYSLSRESDKTEQETFYKTLGSGSHSRRAAVLQEGVIFRAEKFVLIERRWSFFSMHRSLIFSSRSVLSAHKEESKTAQLMMKCFEMCFFFSPCLPKAHWFIGDWVIDCVRIFKEQ